MKWRKDIVDGLLTFEAEAIADSSADQNTSARAVWALVADEILPRHQPDDWNRIRVEFWPDSGRMIVFPAREPFEERTDRALAQVKWLILQTTWDKCETDDSIDDEAFETVVAGVTDSIVCALRDAFDKSLLRNRVRVDCYLYGEELLCSFGKP